LLTKGTGWVNKIGTGHSLHKMTTLGISGNKLTVCIVPLSLSNQMHFKTSTGAHTKVGIKSYGSALVKPPIGIVTTFAKV
jgi:hypothetical protein